MPAHARKDIVREGEVACYHCWSRCVQRSFLCGLDPVTGRDFNYRRGWIEDLLAYQASVFALDVGNYNLLSNHAHTILRTRPDIAATWSHEELAWRWKLAWPEFRDGQWIREPTDQQIEELLKLPEKLEQIRKHLSSLSWFMARWKEPIARLCNAETDSSGHFWEARFGSRELLDEQAVLACNIYVDLNQLRAGMADTLEESQYSAIRNRILAAKRREAQASQEEFADLKSADLYSFSAADADSLFEDCWLAPISDDGPLLTADSLPKAAPQIWLPSRVRQELSSADVDPAETEALDDIEGVAEPSTTPSELEDNDTQETTAERSANTEEQESPARLTQRRRRPRASDAPFIDVPWEQYLQVLETVAAFTGDGTSCGQLGDGAVKQLHDVLQGWGINGPAWLTELDQLDRRCTRALGAAHRVLKRAGEVAQRWFHGLGWCREIFVDAPSDAFT